MAPPARIATSSPEAKRFLRAQRRILPERPSGSADTGRPAAAHHQRAGAGIVDVGADDGVPGAGEGIGHLSLAGWDEVDLLEFDAEMIEMQPRDLLVEMFRQHIDLLLVPPGVRVELELRDHLVGERG